MATGRAVPFAGGEPSDKSTLEIVRKKGFSANDLLSFEFVRRMPQINRSGDLKKKDIETIYLEYVQSKAKDYKIKEATFTFEQFKAWYANKQGREFSLTSGGQGETAPLDEGPFYTQKISLEVTRGRDENILSTIAGMLNKYNNVLVIYGSSHYRIQHEALTNALGGPKELAPF